ncbi:MAG TPA: hypothetical protein VJB34_05340 [Bdellovibrionota bacterium]|nr:hypothetical protein [Bdellovibrionota bacterium]
MRLLCRLAIIILFVSNVYPCFAQETSKYWELPSSKEKLALGKILTESQVIDLEGEKKRLDVVAFAYVDYNKDTLRKIKNEYKNMTQLSKNIHESRILYKKGDLSIVYLDVCFLWCSTHYNVVVSLKTKLDKKVDKIYWQFLTHEETLPYTPKEVAEVPEELDFPGMKGETLIQEVSPAQSLVAIQGSLITEKSGFIRFFQKMFLKGALRNTAQEMRKNLGKLESFKPILN